jgi:hypothetical protein
MQYLTKGFLARRAILQLFVVITIVGTASAQDHRLTADIGAGYTPLVGAIGDRLDNGWHITFGAGYNFTDKFSILGRFMYNGFGVNRNVLIAADVPGADAHLIAVTAEPRIKFASSSHRVVPYFVGGVGYYRRTVNFTQPTLAAVTIFDPFFGFTNILVPANQIIGSIVRDGIGGNAGLGFEFRLGNSAKIFTEARFHYADNGGVTTRMVPWTVGVRF